jgi:hypothetical protein
LWSPFDRPDPSRTIPGILSSRAWPVHREASLRARPVSSSAAPHSASPCPGWCTPSYTVNCTARAGHLQMYLRSLTGDSNPRVFDRRLPRMAWGGTKSVPFCCARGTRCTSFSNVTSRPAPSKKSARSVCKRLCFLFPVSDTSLSACFVASRRSYREDVAFGVAVIPPGTPDGT